MLGSGGPGHPTNWRTVEKLSEHFEIVAKFTRGCRAADPGLVGGLTCAPMSGSVLGYIFVSFFSSTIHQLSSGGLWPNGKPVTPKVRT